MKSTGKVVLGALVMLFLVIMLWGMGYITFKAPSTPQPSTPSTQLGYYPLKFSVKRPSGANVPDNVVVELYRGGDGGIWQLIGSYTTSSGVVNTGSDNVQEGEELMVHVVGDTYSSVVITDSWTKIKAGYKQPDLTYVVGPTVTVLEAPASASSLDIKMFDSNWNTIGTTDATATQLSLSGGAADWVQKPGVLKLILNDDYSGFGGVVNQPATSKGHLAKQWVSVVTVEFNRTDISFASSGWAQVSGTSSSIKKYAIIVDRLEAKSQTPVSKELQFMFKATGLSANTPFKITVNWYDYQLWSDAQNNIFNTSAVAPDPAATYTKSATFYFKVVA